MNFSPKLQSIVDRFKSKPADDFTRDELQTIIYQLIEQFQDDLDQVQWDFEFEISKLTFN